MKMRIHTKYLSGARAVMVVPALSVVIALASGAFGAAQAQSRYADPRGYEANTASIPAPFEPAGGGWRYGVLRAGGCRHSYPMAEQAGCGTASGGPAGGIN